MSDGEAHPSRRIEEAVHQRVRLGILAVLAEVERADFRYIRRALDVTDGNLSGHLQVLEEAGYVEVSKTFEGRKPRTWVSATSQGRAALGAEVAILRELVARYDKQPDVQKKVHVDQGRRA